MTPLLPTRNAGPPLMIAVYPAKMPRDCK